MLKWWIVLAGVISGTPVRPVTWAAVAPKTHAAAGSTLSVALTATIDDGWHLYSTTQPPGGPVPTRVTILASPVFAANGPITFPKPNVAPDPNFGINVETYDRAVTFTIPVRIAADAKAGVDTLMIETKYQACNATLCLPPRTQPIPVPVTIRPS